MLHLNAKYKLDQSQPGPEPWERERVRPAPSGEIEMRIMLEYLGPGGGTAGWPGWRRSQTMVLTCKGVTAQCDAVST